MADGLDMIEFHMQWDRYKADHNPRFHIILIILNFVIFEFEIYNVNHCDDNDAESSALEKYRRLLKTLRTLRNSHKGAESAEEDHILEEMNRVWLEMTDEERKLFS
jgi:hypothetical protein